MVDSDFVILCPEILEPELLSAVIEWRKEGWHVHSDFGESVTRLIREASAGVDLLVRSQAKSSKQRCFPRKFPR